MIFYWKCQACILIEQEQNTFICIDFKNKLHHFGTNYATTVSQHFHQVDSTFPRCITLSDLKYLWYYSCLWGVECMKFDFHSKETFLWKELMLMLLFNIMTQRSLWKCARFSTGINWLQCRLLKNILI